MHWNAVFPWLAAAELILLSVGYSSSEVLHINCCSFRYVIAYVLLAIALEWNFGAHNAQEYTNLILFLINFVQVLAARQSRVHFTNNNIS